MEKEIFERRDSAAEIDRQTSELTRLVHRLQIVASARTSRIARTLVIIADKSDDKMFMLAKQVYYSAVRRDLSIKDPLLGRRYRTEERLLVAYADWLMREAEPGAEAVDHVEGDDATERGASPMGAP